MLREPPGRKIQILHSFLHKSGCRDYSDRALRIPREWELDGDEAIIHREGDRLIVEPVRKGGLLSLLARLQPLDEAFPEIDDALPPLDDVKL